MVDTIRARRAAPELVNDTAVALWRLAEEMGAQERDARERRDYQLASAFRNREEAYRHAAAIASHLGCHKDDAA